MTVIMRTGVCVESGKMKITNCSWISTTLKLLLAASLPVMQGSAYRILALPYNARGHVFEMSVLAVGLANRGHKVTFFIGENFRLSLPEVGNQTGIGVVRYRDVTDGVHMDYDAIEESDMKKLMESGGDVIREFSDISTTYV